MDAGARERSPAVSPASSTLTKDEIQAVIAAQSLIVKQSDEMIQAHGQGAILSPLMP
jgi:hypothetical protein